MVNAAGRPQSSRAYPTPGRPRPQSATVGVTRLSNAREPRHQKLNPEAAQRKNEANHVTPAVVLAKVPIMNVPISTPAFEARHLCLASGWYVRVAWPNGKRDHIPGFVTQQEAQRWIEVKAPSWLSERRTASKAFSRFATA